MSGLHIEYQYQGDENEWQEAIKTFLNNIENDSKLKGRMRYLVFVKEDGVSRVHLPTWDSEETLAHLQSQTFFREFAEQVKKFAGGGLKVTKPKLSTM